MCLDLFFFFFFEGLENSDLLLSHNYIFLLFLSFSIVHLLNLFILLALVKSQLLLSVAHYPELFFLQNLHPADLQRAATQNIQQRFSFVVEVE